MFKKKKKKMRENSKEKEINSDQRERSLIPTFLTLENSGRGKRFTYSK